MSSGLRPRIGLLGGSFDPIHVAHLALGRAAAVALALDRILVIPTGESWQKHAAGRPAPTAASHRLAMARLAVASIDAPDGCTWSVDDTEVRRQGATYTVETLIELRHREGPRAALVLILGSDQLRNLASWYRWTELLEHAHLAVTQREQVPLVDLPAAVEALVAERGTQALPDTPSGSIVFFRMPAVPVSATRLRDDLAAGRPVDALLPAGVADYIMQHRLYPRSTPSR